MWSAPSLALLLLVLRRGDAYRAALRTPRTAASLLLAALLVTGNWLVFIIAVNTNHLLDASLGYFVTPLVNVALGALVLRERLRPGQLAAVGLAIPKIWVLASFLGQDPDLGWMFDGRSGLEGSAGSLGLDLGPVPGLKRTRRTLERTSLPSLAR